MITTNNHGTDQDVIIETCLDETVRHLTKIGLAPTFSEDLSGWVAMIESAPGRDRVNPTFHPLHSDVTPDNAFWIKLTDADTGRAIACIANRVFETDDWLEVMRSQRLWFRSPPGRPIDIVPDSLPLIAGRVGHHGGLWIHPEFRKHGLSGFMTRLARCRSLGRWNVDWHCGLVAAKIAEKGLPTTPVTGYGYPRMALVIDGRYPVIDHPERVFVPWISRDEMLAQLAAETARLIGDRDEQRIHSSAATA
jgi:hypothetical protein